MSINKFHYKQLGETQKIYVDGSTLKIREQLNNDFKKPIAEDDTTGITGKYNKLDKMYKIKYIYSRNKQLQPMMYERYYYLLDVGEDEYGTFVEYTMVYDKLYDPLIRTVYILSVVAIIFYLYYLYSKNVLTVGSAGTLGVIIALSVVLIMKKSRETEEVCKKAEKTLKNLIFSIKKC